MYQVNEEFTVKLTHVETTEDLKLAEAILQKFDHTPEALELQPSLAYSLVRNYFDFAQKQRVQYGIFLHRLSANLLLNLFLLEKNTKVKVKVHFVHNQINHDHFDLINKRTLLGKTIVYLSSNANNSGMISLQEIFFIKKKLGRICAALQTILDNDQLQFYKTITKILEKELDEYVYNIIEAKERLPPSSYQHLELISKAVCDIIKNLLEIAAFADKHDTKKTGTTNIYLDILLEDDELLNVFENESRIVIHSQDKEFADETFENARAPGEHDYFELTRQHYHWNRMKTHRSLHLDKKLHDEEMSDVRNWPPYKYLAENWNI
ncbi:unnamed protein product [Rotaria sp. Silwood2]|nr:unnamed protein product [Rotaria sp. Silwood2]